MTLPLPAHDPDEEDGPHLYTHGPLTPRWAQRVKRHQRGLMRSLRRGSTQSIPAPRNGFLPLPRCIEDLKHAPGRAREYTSPYRGVVKRRWHPGFAAYLPPGYGLARRKIGGVFPSGEAAAMAVLLELNPNVTPNPTGDPA